MQFPSIFQEEQLLPERARLGGVIDNHKLRDIVSEIGRVLKTGGIVVLVENTNDSEDCQLWHYRPVEFYQSLFEYVNLEHCADYHDLGERISIMLGKTNV